MRTHSFAVSISILARCIGLAARCVLAGCRSLPPSKPESLSGPRKRPRSAGVSTEVRQVPLPNDTRPLNGPGLQAITKVKAMPTGTPPTDERHDLCDSARPQHDAGNRN